jgi:uncharacterized protein (TIGR03086 family)
MDALRRLEASIDQTRPIVAATRADQLGQPTNCPDWDVRGLLNHTVGALVMFRDVANEGEADVAALMTDQIGDDPLAAYDLRAKEVLEAWRAKGTDGTANLPFGEFPAEFGLSLLADDQTVHGWDLARATGQDVAWDQDLAQEHLDFATATFGPAPEMRGTDFAAEVEAPPDADTMTRLVAFLGRQP